ncbi:MAG TPA: permease [Polyangiaceae bacterium]|nr:permease [Polyangiaceae bacterium]
MIIALIIAAASIVGGSVLALLPTRRSQILGPIRTFGLTASGAVVLLHLLPEVYEARGVFGLLAFVAALLAPSALRSLMRVATSSHNDTNAEWVTLRITYLSLLVHSVADGIALSAYSGHMHHGKPHYDVLVALSAHTVPVAAVMTLTFRDFRGVRFALFGALGLWIATSIGVIGAGLVPHAAVQGASAWVGAVVAGLLLHVVTHDLGGHAPTRPVERAVDLLAATAGIGVGLLSGDAHSHLSEAQGMGPTLGHALLQVTLKAAPLLLLGLGANALLQTFRPRVSSAWFAPRGVLRDGVQGALIAFWSPLASCDLLGTAKLLIQRGASAALVVAFSLAGPVLGLETLALTLGFLGWQLAWIRLGGALAVAACTALVIGLLARPAARAVTEWTDIELGAGSQSSAPRRFLAAFENLFQHNGALMILGIVAAAFVDALVPPAAARAIESPLLELVVVTLLTLPSYVCAPSAIPLAAVLIAKGISPGAVLVALLLGPAFNSRILSLLRASYGARACMAAIVVSVSLVWAIAFGVNRGPFEPAVPDLFPVWVSAVAALVLVGLWLRSLWRWGTRGWFASVLQPGTSQPHAHGPGSGHGSAPALLEPGSALR